MFGAVLYGQMPPGYAYSGYSVAYNIEPGIAKLKPITNFGNAFTKIPEEYSRLKLPSEYTRVVLGVTALFNTFTFNSMTFNGATQTEEKYTFGYNDLLKSSTIYQRAMKTNTSYNNQQKQTTIYE